MCAITNKTTVSWISSYSSFTDIVYKIKESEFLYNSICNFMFHLWEEILLESLMVKHISLLVKQT